MILLRAKRIRVFWRIAEARLHLVPLAPSLTLMELIPRTVHAGVFLCAQRVT
jgi:hypothetical protein